MLRAVERRPPIRELGEEGCYYTFTLRHLTSEPVRRVGGTIVGRIVYEEIIEPLGDVCLKLSQIGIF